MPQLALSAASFTAAAAPAVATTAAKVGFMATMKSVAVNLLMNAAITAAMSALQPQVGAAGRTGEWLLSPDGPIPFAAGRVGVAGSAIDIDTFGPDLMYKGFVTVLSGAGPIDGFETFQGDDELVTFDVTGKAVTSQWKGEMWLKRSLGEQPDVALSPPTGLKNNAVMPGWAANRRLSGKACDMLVLGENSKGSAYPTGEVKPLRVFRGLRVWDPRLDSTYPGGVGPCRLSDPSTWVYSANPGLWAIKWSLGLWEGPLGKGAPQVDRQVGGIGAKASGIEFETLVALANIADANGWTCAAYPTTDDDKSQVLDAFLQAAGAIYAQRAGKISCIQRAAPRTSIVTISVADTAGPLEIDTAASRIDRINTIRPRFWSEPHRWQLTALKEVTAEAYQIEDGAERPRGIDYPFVTNAKQAAQLAALQIANTREGIAGVIPLKPHLQRIRPGDAFTITEPGFVLNGLKCLCLNTDYDPATGVVRVSFVSETDQKYPFALGQSPVPPAPPVLMPSDPTLVSPPNPDDWAITPRPPGSGGTLVPGFDLSGFVSNSMATAIEVQWWEVPEGVDPMAQPPEEADWQSAGTWPPTATTIPINVQGNRYYWIGLIYIRGQNYSTRTAIGPWLAGKLIAGGLAPDAAQELLDEATKEVNDKVRDALDQFEKSADLDGLFAAQEDLAEAVLKLGRGVTELQRVTETNTRDGGKLVKSIVRVMGGELDNAQGAIVQEAALSLQRDQAEALLREALALQVDENRATAENSLSALVTDLAAEVTDRTALGARVELAEGAISAEAMVRANEDGVFVQNFGLLGARRPDQSGWILNKETVDLTGEGSLASVLSGLRITDGENSSSIVTLQTASGNQASQLTTLSNTVGDQTLSISQLLVVTQGLGARYTLSLDGSGAATQFIADGQTRAIVFKAASLTITDDGSGLSYVPATGRLTLTKGGMRTVLGAGGSLILWAGSTSIPAGAELVDNGVLGISNDDAWFGGATANGPFTTGSPSGQIDLTKNVWTTVASVAARRLQNEGDLFAQLQFEVNVAGAPDDDNDYTVQFRIAVANLDGSGAVGVVGNFGGFPVNTWAAIDTYLRGHISTARGPKRLLLQINPTGSTITTASVRSARMDGQYAGASFF